MVNSMSMKRATIVLLLTLGRALMALCLVLSLGAAALGAAAERLESAAS